MSIFIHKSLEYKRRKDLENEINSTICIKIRRNKNRWACIVATYRQWTGMSTSCSYNSRSRSDGLARLNDLIDLYKKILNEGNDTVFCGDFNIDRLKENNPSDRYDLKLIIPVFEDFLIDNKISQLNFKATRHCIGQRSSLLDLYLTTSPDKCTNVHNIVNLSSEHEGVALTFKIKGAINKDQFSTIRNTRNIIA